MPENLTLRDAITQHCDQSMNLALGGCPRIEAVARESGFESYFSMI